MLVKTHYEECDHSTNTHFADYGRAALESAPHGAMVLINEDVNSNSMKYLQQCEGVRRDLRLVSIPLITYKVQPNMQHGIAVYAAWDCRICSMGLPYTQHGIGAFGNANFLTHLAIHTHSLAHLCTSSQAHFICSLLLLPPFRFPTMQWWSNTQLHHHPNVSFPGARHHPFELGSFSMEQFLQANILGKSFELDTVTAAVVPAADNSVANANNNAGMKNEVSEDPSSHHFQLHHRSYTS
jgi:hypothetical protein